MRLESGKVTEGRLIPAGGQIFRNSNLTGSFPTPTSVKDGAAPLGVFLHPIPESKSRDSVLRFLRTRGSGFLVRCACGDRTHG